MFGRLAEELDRIEGAIDPYSDPDLQAQWSLCINNIMRHQRRLEEEAEGAEREQGRQAGKLNDSRERAR